jgi:hypothetical protein
MASILRRSALANSAAASQVSVHTPVPYSSLPSQQSAGKYVTLVVNKTTNRKTIITAFVHSAAAVRKTEQQGAFLLVGESNQPNFQTDQRDRLPQMPSLTIDE